MTELRPDQVPDGWSAGAAGYEAAFARFTGGYADVAVDLLGVGSGDRVLDVAAGTGAFSLRAAAAGAEVLATDFAPGMVELLAGRFAEAGLERCRAEVMDGQALAVPDASFDVAASMFGLIFFPDQAAGLRELARAVRPGGRVCVTTWRVEGFPLVDLVGMALQAALPGAPEPPPDPSWARIGDVEGLTAGLVGAGLVDVEVHVVPQQWVLDDPAGFFGTLPEWSPPVQPLFEALSPETIDRAATAFGEVWVQACGAADGVVMDALVGIARRG